MAELGSMVSRDRSTINRIKEEIAKVIVGQEDVVDGFMRALMANGHVLIEGVPGLAKTLMIRSLAKAIGCDFSRVQFTPDLLPTDIVGITAYDKQKGFYVVKGPIFSNLVLADEINRAPPKVQSALLECMQEKQATIGNRTFPMKQPFFVMATQNPLENLGTYPLPEAQMDRFMFKLNIGYPTLDNEEEILKKNISTRTFESFPLKAVTSPSKILTIQNDVQKIYIDKKIEKYIVKIVDATRHPDTYKITLGKYIEWGASPRASIGIFISAKAQALMSGKTFVIPEYVKKVVPDVLRHRLIINYEGQAEGITPNKVISEVLEKIEVP
ncbi:ATPase [Candidatus Woesearchaeota archaeon CG07_land_8_20_14_0_80_44_23]|nr:MAG: ATPase [Candidatus Woesearchaeota archaeon CG07_land_8_20_14_0_80_44_23]